MFSVEPLIQNKLDDLLTKDHTVVTLEENDKCFKLVPPFTGKCYCCWDWQAFSLLVLDGMVPKIDDQVVSSFRFLSSDLVLFNTDDHYVFYSISNRSWVTIEDNFYIKIILDQYHLFELYRFDDSNNLIKPDKNNPNHIHYYYDYSNHSSFETLGEYQPGCERLNVKKRDMIINNYQ